MTGGSPQTEQPKRIQRSRSNQWRMPRRTWWVAAPSKFSNPFEVGNQIGRDDPCWPYVAESVPGGAGGFTSLAVTTPEQALDLFTCWFIEQPHLMLSARELAGLDLCCWCRVGAPCHADWLLELVNEGGSDDR